VIILDTNVLSALMRDMPEEAVEIWLDKHPRPSIWTTSVTVFEIRVGLLALPPGRRRSRLERDFERCVDERLASRVVEFDRAAAEATAVLLARRKQVGLSVDLRDGMIAGIAIAGRATLATRNTRHFADLPVPVVNPWAD
jgi:toxin FitB